MITRTGIKLHDEQQTKHDRKTKLERHVLCVLLLSAIQHSDRKMKRERKRGGGGGGGGAREYLFLLATSYDRE